MDLEHVSGDADGRDGADARSAVETRSIRTQRASSSSSSRRPRTSHAPHVTRATRNYPSRGKQETTLYVVCYDVVDDRRRNRVHALLSGYGAWTQYSVFECYLTRQQLVTLRARLADAMNTREDTIRLYALCDTCRGRVEVLGCGEKPQEPSVFIF